MKKILVQFLFIAIGFLPITIYSQQESQFTFFMHNKQYLNPGYVGSEGEGSILAIYRKQWIGFNGAPTSQIASFNKPFARRRVGLGLLVTHSEKGIFDAYQGTLSYSYAVLKTENTQVRIGLHGSYKSISSDPNNPNSVIGDPSDPSIGTKAIKKSSGNIGSGIYMQSHNFYVGLSCPNILESVLGINPNSAYETAISSRHYYLMSGASIPITENFNLLTSALFKYVKNSPLDIEVHLGLDFLNALSTGLSYRAGGSGSGDSIDLLALFHLSSEISLGAAYDYTLSKIDKGSIEGMFRYDFASKNSKLSNPRFFF